MLRTLGDAFVCSRRLATVLRLPCSRRRQVVVVAVAAVVAACSPMRGTAHVGYARLQLDGGIALASAGSGGGGVQGIGSTFGLGDPRDAACARVATAFGPIELAATGFVMRESGTGSLGSSFGGLVAGTAVSTDFELANVQLSAVYELPVGPFTLAPGAAFDVFAVDLRVSADPQNREEVDDVVGVPLPFVRLRLPTGDLQAIAELGWLDANDLIGSDARFLDASAMVEWRPGGASLLVAGWRHLGADASGASGADTAVIDLSVSGWFVGGGVVF
jgi:hypothetical protein